MTGFLVQAVHSVLHQHPSLRQNIQNKDAGTTTIVHSEQRQVPEQGTERLNVVASRLKRIHHEWCEAEVAGLVQGIDSSDRCNSLCYVLGGPGYSQEEIRRTAEGRRTRDLKGKGNHSSADVVVYKIPGGGTGIVTFDQVSKAERDNCRTRMNEFAADF